MEIRVLRYFLAVAQEEGITRAAELLHITQPTLSRQIAQLEEEMGVPLFDRGTRKLVLTSEGLLLRRRAEEILELVDKTEREVTGQGEQIAGTVSVGCGDLDAVQVLPELFRGFRARYPAVNFELYTATADHIKERMERGLTDVGLLLEPVDMEQYDYIRLTRGEEWVVLLPPESPLAKLEQITPRDLRGVPLILPRRLSVQSELARWFGEEYEHLNVVLTSNLTSNSAVMSHCGLACAVAIRGSISFWDPARILCRPLFPTLKATSVLAWRRKQPFGAAAGRFIQYARQTLKEEGQAAL